MDQIKIGKFIAQCRKEQGMTQMQLAEKLGITDRAVSKWETGKSMPEHMGRFCVNPKEKKHPKNRKTSLRNPSA